MNALIAVGVGLLFFVYQWRVYRGARASTELRCRRWAESCRDGKRRGQTRESAVLDLERSLANSPEMTLLRRLGVVAPLIGVALTAFSVLFLGLGGTPGPTQAMLLDSPDLALVAARVINPLFWGVLTGAILAILNQGFAHLATKFEDLCFAESTDLARAVGFRDTDDRLDALTKQFEEAAVRLGQSAGIVDAMLKSARAAMEGMNEACNEAATELGGLSTRLNDALRAPTKEFVEAAANMRKTALDAAKQFSTGVTTLSKQASVVEQRVGTAIERNLQAVAAQARSTDAAIQAVEAIEARVSAIPTDAFSTLAKQVRAAEASFDGFHQELQRLSSGIPSVMARFAEAVNAESSRIAMEAKSLPELLRPATDQLTAETGRISSAFTAIGDCADTTRLALARLAEATDARSGLELTFRYNLEAASEAIRGLETSAGRVPVDQLAVNINALQELLAKMAAALQDATSSIARLAGRLPLAVAEGPDVAPSSTEIAEVEQPGSVVSSSSGLRPSVSRDLSGEGRL